jgi:hypothetical protein
MHPLMVASATEDRLQQALVIAVLANDHRRPA